ncbi:MAG: N-acyl-D-glucosamine 2-epimerase [Anaerolinea sp.]|nr:N-acyl-D-glucosamine 2-epimerase [Anaerolinea sp.]
MQPIITKDELKSQFEAELRENILPYWMNKTPDRQNGGFYGVLTNDNQIHNEVERSAVLNSRILWTFSTAALLYQDEAYLSTAKWAMQALTQHFWDSKHEGIFWSVDAAGNPVNDRKHVYAQAFSIYGLSAYYLATQDMQALQLAKRLFELIDQHTYDPQFGGNIECRARDWSRLEDMRLSSIDLNSSKSMNTMLHLLEACTALTGIWQDAKLTKRFEDLIALFSNTIIDSESGHQHLFFDDQWRSLSEHISYGHDIETSWLLLEAADASGQSNFIDQAKSNAVKMAQVVYEQSLQPDGSILYEAGPGGHKVTDRHWWAHAEAVVGFYNAFQVSKKELFLHSSTKVWTYIQDHFIDRKDGDWYKLLREDGSPYLEHYKVSPWECPYHHARMCFEMIRRLSESSAD